MEVCDIKNLMERMWLMLVGCATSSRLGLAAAKSIARNYCFSNSQSRVFMRFQVFLGL